MIGKVGFLAIGLLCLHGSCAVGQMNLGMSEPEARAILAVETAAASAALQRLAKASAAMMQAPSPSEAPKAAMSLAQGDAQACLFCTTCVLQR